MGLPGVRGKVATRRADDLATVMRAVHERGGSAFMLTLTMRHARGDRLGLSTTERRRRDLLEERRADREVAEANGWDVDERDAEAEDIETRRRSRPRGLLGRARLRLGRASPPARRG